MECKIVTKLIVPDTGLMSFFKKSPFFKNVDISTFFVVFISDYSINFVITMVKTVIPEELWVIYCVRLYRHS